MIKNLSNPSENVAVFEISGIVSKQDYQDVIFPEVKKLHDHQNEINLVYILDTKIADYSLGAMWEDFLVGMKYFENWNRVAFVSDNKNLNETVDFFSNIFHGTFKGFQKSEQAEALNWAKNG